MPPGKGPQEDLSEQHYSNHLDVGFNQVEFMLVFGQVREGSASRAVCELVTNPTFAKAFSQTMAEAIDQFERRYGRIPDPKDLTGESGE